MKISLCCSSEALIDWTRTRNILTAITRRVPALSPSRRTSSRRSRHLFLFLRALSLNYQLQFRRLMLIILSLIHVLFSSWISTYLKHCFAMAELSENVEGRVLPFPVSIESETTPGAGSHDQIQQIKASGHQLTYLITIAPHLNERIRYHCVMDGLRRCISHKNREMKYLSSRCSSTLWWGVRSSSMA